MGCLGALMRILSSLFSKQSGRRAAFIGALAMSVAVGVVLYLDSDRRWGIEVHPGTDFVQVQLDAEIDEAEQWRRARERLAQHPDRDLVIEPPRQTLSAPEQRKQDKKMYAAALAESAKYVEEGLAEGRFVEGTPPECEQRPTGGLPVQCNGRLKLPKTSEQERQHLAKLSESQLQNSLTEELNTVLQGVTKEDRALGFESTFGGAATVSSVALSGDLVTVDFSVSLADELEHAHSYQWDMAYKSLAATVFKYPQADALQFTLAGDCAFFSGEPDGQCVEHTRQEWSESINN